MDTTYLSVDIGANGGKMYAGRIDGDHLEFSEVHRFDNRPVERDGRYVWDVPHLTTEVADGIEKADAMASDLASVAVDTWGVDFGLFADGDLIQPPYAYRDQEISSTKADLLAAKSKREIFEATGLNHWNAECSLWQYHYLSREEPAVLEAADRIAMMPQVITAGLGGRPAGEATIASTTQMLDPRERDWAWTFLRDLDLPVDPLPEIEPVGTSVGSLSPEIGRRIDSDPELLLPTSHDTAAAVAAMPFDGDNRAFLSTGTVFIAGVERDEPDLSTAAFEVGATNELGPEGTVRFLRNMNNGFFLVEECRETWREQGKSYAYDELLAGARQADPFRSLVDPDHRTFSTMGDMPAKIADYCRETGQPVPRNEGETTRCILESLAANTALLLDDLLGVAGGSDRVHVGGGGVRNELFCQMVAEATDRSVIAGPVEAAAVGNLFTQARAAGQVDGLADWRALVERSIDFQRYEPEQPDAWDDAKRRVQELGTATDEAS